MPTKHRMRAVALIVVVCSCAACVLEPPASGAAADPSGPPVGLLVIARGDLRAAAPNPYRYVVLNAWDYRRISRIRRSDPGVKVFVYKDMSSTRSYACHDGRDDRFLPTGVGYCWTDRNHPGWFLKDQSGQRIEWRGYPGHWWIDVGDRRYQRRWKRNVVSELRRRGWDGVMVDNAIVDPSYYLASGERISEYPTTHPYRRATGRFLHAVGPKIRAAGFGFVPNIGGGDASAHLLRRWSKFTTGFEREYWCRYGTGPGQPFAGWDWTHQMAQMHAVQSTGKTWFAIAYGSQGDSQLMQYAEASFLLEWNGTSGAVFYRSPAGTDPWSRDWTFDVGTPLGDRFSIEGAWRRDFSNGVVLANPSSQSVSVDLGGQYTRPDGTRVTAVTLGPATGLVLRAA
jgi:hypothetical protein